MFVNFALSERKIPRILEVLTGLLLALIFAAMQGHNSVLRVPARQPVHIHVFRIS